MDKNLNKQLSVDPNKTIATSNFLLNFFRKNSERFIGISLTANRAIPATEGKNDRNSAFNSCN
jgi:hypothetical protein